MDLPTTDAHLKGLVRIRRVAINRIGVSFRDRIPTHDMNAPPKKRWLRFSIRTMLVVTSVFCVLLAILIGAVKWQLRLRRNRGIVAAKGQLSAFEIMLDRYRQDIGIYPTTEQGLLALHVPPSDMRDLSRW